MPIDLWALTPIPPAAETTAADESPYALTLTVPPAPIVVPAAATDLLPYAARYTVATLHDGTPVPNTTMHVVLEAPGIAGTADTETWVNILPTGRQTYLIGPPHVPLTLTLRATWEAPDGLHHATGVIRWTTSGSAPEPAPTPTPPPASAAPAPLVVVPGRIVDDSFQFTADLTGPTGTTQTVPFVCDTGAFEMLLTGDVASALGLPNLGTEDISGVGGSATAYRSAVTLQLGHQRWDTVACVVDPAFTVNLFGLRWWIERAYALLLDPVTATLSVLPTDRRA
jgi:hypothetical protein